MSVMAGNARIAEDRIEVLGTEDAGPAVIRGGALRAAGYVIGVGLGVGAAAVLFRHLGVDEAGRYVTVMSLMGIVGGVSEVGLSALAVRELAVLGVEDRQALMRHLLGLRIAVTTGGVVLAVLFTVLAGYDHVLVLGTLVAGAGLVIQSVQSMLTTPLQAELRFGWVTLLELVRQLVLVVLTIALVAAGAALLPFFALSIGAAAVTLALTLPLVRQAVPQRPSFQISGWAPLVRSTLTLALATAIASVYFRVTVIVMSLIASEAQTGYFGASFRIVEILSLLPLMGIASAFPLFSRAAHDDLARLSYGVQRMFETCLIFGVGLALAVSFGAAVAIDLVAGPNFAPAIPVLQIQAVALGAVSVAALWGYVLASLRRNRELVAITSAALVLAVTLTLALQPSLGAKGAAWATVICELSSACVGAILVLRAVPGMRLSLRLVPRVAATAAAAGSLALVPGIPAAPRTLAALTVYTVGLLLLRAVPEEIFVEVRGALAALRGHRAARAAREDS
jgi:O-antigen/teichoic acid export membrane protein